MIDAESTPIDTRAAVLTRLQSIERKVDRSLAYSIRGYEIAKRNTLGPGIAAFALLLSIVAVLLACNGGLPR